MAGIQLASNFDLNSQIPLDSRTVVADISARNAIAEAVRYDGLPCYVVSEGRYYHLRGGVENSDWAEWAGNGSGGTGGSTSAKAILVNNSANTINEIGDYIVNCPGLAVEYYLLRRVDGEVRRMSGVLRLESLPDEALSVDRWQVIELQRSEYGNPSGVSFSLTEVDTEKSVLVITLDDMAGDNHSCKFFYKLTQFSHETGKVIILDNNSINPISAIGEYLVDAGGILLDYFIYRKTDLGHKTLSGKILIEGNPDAATNPEKWEINEMERSEGDELSGISFSLDPVDTEKSILVVTLDNMPGSDHRCDFYYNKTVLSN